MTDYPRRKAVDKTTASFSWPPHLQVGDVIVMPNGQWQRVKTVSDDGITITTKPVNCFSRWASIAACFITMPFIVVWEKILGVFR